MDSPIFEGEYGEEGAMGVDNLSPTGDNSGVLHTFALPPYKRWYGKLKDRATAADTLVRVHRIERAGELLGERRYLGDGVSELKFYRGSAARVYVAIDSGSLLLLLLCGGDKSSATRQGERHSQSEGNISKVGGRWPTARRGGMELSF